MTSYNVLKSYSVFSSETMYAIEWSYIKGRLLMQSSISQTLWSFDVLKTLSVEDLKTCSDDHLTKDGIQRKHGVEVIVIGVRQRSVCC